VDGGGRGWDGLENAMLASASECGRITALEEHTFVVPSVATCVVVGVSELSRKFRSLKSLSLNGDCVR
jgi:hypothetical protein